MKVTIELPENIDAELEAARGEQSCEDFVLEAVRAELNRRASPAALCAELNRRATLGAPYDIDPDAVVSEVELVRDHATATSYGRRHATVFGVDFHVFFSRVDGLPARLRAEWRRA